MPVVTAVLVQFLTILRSAVLFVLLTPCIDYVVSRGDARLLLAATPAFLPLQDAASAYLSIIRSVVQFS
ncbi:hypothetical protein V1290_005494 [Bradyrhizobium sp. AZCC 1578]|uniref:hypothetical protein n=1 Tax=Bradyrhizobium sp. AZCC 1578 TaxID=3117027 RepID=UPI002FF009DD